MDARTPLRRTPTLKRPRYVALALLALCIGAAALPLLSEAEPHELPPPLGGAWVRRTPYPNCAAARAMGDAPILRGEPGYGPHLDADNDGVGCERYLESWFR